MLDVLGKLLEKYIKPKKYDFTAGRSTIGATEEVSGPSGETGLSTQSPLSTSGAFCDDMRKKRLQFCVVDNTDTLQSGLS